VGLKQVDQPILFRRDGFVNNLLLEIGIARQHDPLVGQILEHDPQQILGFGADVGHFGGKQKSLVPIRRQRPSIARMLQDDLALLPNRIPMGMAEIIEQDIGNDVVNDEGQIRTHLGQVNRKEALGGLEIAELEHKEGLDRAVGPGPYKAGFGGREGEIERLLLSSKGGPIIERRDISSIEQVEPFGTLGGRFWHAGLVSSSRS